jgi:hypothetical protein
VSDPNPCYPQIGWREWLKLPDLGVAAIKAKVDTGARSSALHAFDVETIIDGDKQFVRFKIHPLQRDCDTTVDAIAEVVEYRSVRSSLGEESLRPVIMTTVELLGQRFEVELTLVRRDTMGFRMLLGRQAIRRRFAVDPACSYRNGRLHRRKKRRRTE